MLPCLSCVGSCVASPKLPSSTTSTFEEAEFLYIWGTALDTGVSAPVPPDTIGLRAVRGTVLLTVDLRRSSGSRGQVTHAVIADRDGRSAHHTEHALAADNILFANDFGTGRTFRFDLTIPGVPRLDGSFSAAGPLQYPHSFVRLPSGSVLATYQWQGRSKPPGGLAEIQRNGNVLRWTRAIAPGIDSTSIHPYSLEVLPGIDRVVTTSTSMNADAGIHVQVWRLSDLALLHTLPVPEASSHRGHGSSRSAHHPEHHMLPGEPRVLADGRTVMFGTFTCGLYRIEGLESQLPRIMFSHAFGGRWCAVPVRIGSYWIQTVPGEGSVIALDVSDPAHPVEVSRLMFAPPVRPHWLAVNASGKRLVMTSGAQADPRVHLLSFDPSHGSLDKEPTSIDLTAVAVAGLGTVRVTPHGAVFSNPSPTSKR